MLDNGFAYLSDDYIAFDNVFDEDVVEIVFKKDNMDELLTKILNMGFKFVEFSKYNRRKCEGAVILKLPGGEK